MKKGMESEELSKLRKKSQGKQTAISCSRCERSLRSKVRLKKITEKEQRKPFAIGETGDQLQKSRGEIPKCYVTA